MAGFYSELRRRRVFATVSIYLVAAWLFIQVSDVLFPGWNIAEENIRYLLYAAIAGFPIAFIVGWKYDITTHGIRRTPPVSEVPTGAALPLNRADHALLSFLSLAAIGIVVGFGWNIKSRQTLETDIVLPNSVAVLPFANLSEEPDNEYFSTGLWQELITVMGQIDGFRVTPAISAGYFKGRVLDLAEIKHKLQVANVIIGSVQKATNRVRITLSLSNTGEGASLWSQTYDRDLKDIFAIQSEIAHAVAKVMKVQILGQEEEQLQTRPTRNVEAHDLLMLAREIIPGVADVSSQYHWLNGICLRRTIWMGRGNPDMERTMEAAFKKAIELNPSETIPHISYAVYLRRENRIREAEDQIRQALELDRLYAGAMFQLARVLSIQGKDDEAIEWNERVIEYFDNGYGSLALRYADLALQLQRVKAMAL